MRGPTRCRGCPTRRSCRTAPTADQSTCRAPGPAARDVDEPAERVPAEERALRPADELDLFDVEQLDARRVRVELRHAVEEGRDAPGCPGSNRCRGTCGLLSFRAVNSVKLTFGAKIPASLTMRMPARSMVSAETAVTLTGSLARVLGLLLCGDGHRRQRHPHERIIRGLRRGRRLSGSGRSRQNETRQKHEHHDSLHDSHLGAIDARTGTFRFGVLPIIFQPAGGCSAA